RIIKEEKGNGKGLEENTGKEIGRDGKGKKEHGQVEVAKYEWKPKPVAPVPKPAALTPQTHVETPSASKVKLPIIPIPEYILDIAGGATARLPEDILPIENLNHISSFLRATVLRDETSFSSSEDSDEPIFMADLGPNV
ncbi:hypothetical protein ACLOJK_041271, partial [Asimina triloba]